MGLKSIVGKGVVLLALVLLSACGAMIPSSIALRNLSPEASARVTQAMSSAAAAQKFLSGTTAISVSEDYGTQIEYLAPDGSSFLWFPGQLRTTPGHWRVDGGAAGNLRMCFLYGANSYDPVQRTYGGNWECGPLKLYIWHLYSLAKGDPFKLSRSVAPFVIPPNELLFDFRSVQQYGKSKVSQAPVTYLFNRMVPPGLPAQ